MNALGTAPTWQQIAERAYQLYIFHGKPEGRDMVHWLQAEEELKQAVHPMPAQYYSAVSHSSGALQPALSSPASDPMEIIAPTPPELGDARSDQPARPPQKTGTKAGGRENSVGNREDIQKASHRVMGSRQSQRRLERSGERRQPKRGRGSQHAKE